jgi:hypothetical protein
MRFQTASSLLALAGETRKSMERIDYPFVVFHDPGDAVVKVSGSLELVRKAATGGDKRKRKLFVTVENGLHDLFANKLEEMVAQSIEWVELNLNNFEVSDRH